MNSLSQAILAQRLLMDEIATILVRGGLSPRLHCSNGLSVYNIEEVNEFDGRFEPEVKLLGYIHFQGVVHFRLPDIHSEQFILDLSDPNCHITLLKFFGIEDYKFQIFKDHNVFDDVNLSESHGFVNANHRITRQDNSTSS